MGHTPITDIYTLVNVKYAYDYEEDDYKKETGYCDGYDFFGNGDGFSGYYINGLEDGYKYKNNGLEREGNILEFESKYIRDRDSALNLRNKIYLENCNRHLLINLSLPLKYTFLEVGDIVSFEKILNNLKEN